MVIPRKYEEWQKYCTHKPAFSSDSRPNGHKFDKHFPAVHLSNQLTISKNQLSNTLHFPNNVSRVTRVRINKTSTRLKNIEPSEAEVQMGLSAWERDRKREDNSPVTRRAWRIWAGPWGSAPCPRRRWISVCAVSPANCPPCSSGACGLCNIGKRRGNRLETYAHAYSSTAMSKWIIASARRGGRQNFIIQASRAHVSPACRGNFGQVFILFFSSS